MQRWLILTTVDPQVRPNNREHNLLRHLAGRFDEVDVVFRRYCLPGRRLDSLRDALVYRSSAERIGNVNYIAVNPFLNHREGMVRDLTGISRECKRYPVAGVASRAVYASLGPLGILKDISTIGCLAAAARARVHDRAGVLCTALGPWAATAAWLLRRSGEIPHFIYEDRDYEPGFVDSSIRKAWVRRLENRMMREADEVITIGRRLKQLRQAETGRDPVLIPTGVDRNAFSCRPGRRNRVLVYTGKLATWSGLIPVIEALPEIAKAIPDVRLRIVGNGPEEALRAIEVAGRRTGCSGRIDILGARPHNQIAALLDDSMVGLATFEPNELRTFAMPLKVVEYMAAGLPIIATAGTETADVIRHHNCGRSVPLEPRAIAAAAIRLLNDSKGWAEMSANAVAASTTFNWATLMEAEWEVMQRIGAQG